MQFKKTFAALIALWGVVLFVSTAALADDCKSITDPTARLACFDKPSAFSADDDLPHAATTEGATTPRPPVVRRESEVISAPSSAAVPVSDPITSFDEDMSPTERAGSRAAKRRSVASAILSYCGVDDRNSQASSEVCEAWKADLKKWFAYRSRLMDENIATLYRQKIASDVVLGLVVFVVLAGVSFSGFQLWKSATTTRKAAAGSSNVEVSLTKFRITTSVVGVVVLTISLAFLYIYATQVYQIKLLGISD